MTLKKNLSTEESREFWENTEKCIEYINSWPQWKKEFIKKKNMNMNLSIIYKCLNIFDKHDCINQEYELACFAMYKSLTQNHIDLLKYFIEFGPLYDGDCSCKDSGYDLLEFGLLTKICINGEQGYTAATYRGWDVINITNE